MQNLAGSADNDYVKTLIGGIEELSWRLPVALYRSAPDGSLLAANPALADLLGYASVGELLDAEQGVDRYYVEPDERDEWLRQIAEAGEVLDFDIELKRRDGSTLWVQDTARAVYDATGRVLYCEGALIDMTDKVRAKRARNEFVATVSHELRNPLAVLLGLAQELASNYDSFSDGERREMADMMAHQADDASWIIEDLLVAYREDMSRVSIVGETFDVTEEVERALEGAEKPVGFEPEEEVCRVNADPRRTRQILRNLVSNAVRYGGEEIKVVTRRGVDDTVDILVCDNGDALDTDEAERIFESYETGNGPLDARSVGLGLSVARKLARMMGGNLVYQHDGIFASFIVTLPAAL